MVEIKFIFICDVCKKRKKKTKINIQAPVDLTKHIINIPTNWVYYSTTERLLCDKCEKKINKTINKYG